VTLRDKWEERSSDWIRWASTPGHDHYFWRVNLPTLLSLLPAPGRLTLDIGCGEGRMGRELISRGHRVVGIESSPTLARAALSGDPAVDVHVADAAAMPLADGAADLVVASMSLMNMDDLPAVIAEIARVLEPGGRFCFSIVHPFNSWRQAGGGSYFDERDYAVPFERAGLHMEFHDHHRPLASYVRALEAGGFHLETMREPHPGDDHLRDHPDAASRRDTPLFLHMRTVKSD
jgi:SAM-dependent methyltransferase